MITRVRRNFAELGPRGMAARFFTLVREGFIAEDFLVLYKDLAQVADLSPRTQIRVEEMTEAHFDALSDLNRRRGTPHADRYFRETMASGVRGLAAFEGEELVGYIQWVEDESAAHHDVWFMGPDFELAPGEVYLSGLFMLPVRRGHGAGSAFLAAFEAHLRDRGRKRVCCFVETSNTVARRLYAKHGWEVVRTVHYRRLVLFRWRRVGPRSRSRPL